MPVGSSARMMGGIGRQGAGDRRALLLTAGYGSRQLVGLFFQPHIFSNSIARSGRSLDRVDIAVIHRQHGVFQQGQRRKQLEKLEHNPCIAAAPYRAFAFRHFVNILPADDHFAGGGVVNPGQHVQQGRFAAARFADNGHKLPVANLQVDPFQAGNSPAAFK